MKYSNSNQVTTLVEQSQLQLNGNFCPDSLGHCFKPYYLKVIILDNNNLCISFNNGNLYQMTSLVSSDENIVQPKLVPCLV